MKKAAILIIISIVLLSFLACEEAVKEITTTISGTITDEGTPVVGAYVFAMQGLTIDGLLSLDIDLNSGTKVLSESGSYVIPALSPDTFQVIVIEDVNENNIIDYGTDRIGIYGDYTVIGDNTIPTSLTDVIIEEEGQDIEDIDIDRLFDFGF